MYKSPIEIIQNNMFSNMQMDLENGIIKAVHRVDINVDKEELLKALGYDRGQYDKGYEDGMNASKWIPCSERLPDRYCHCLVTRRNDYYDGSFDSDVREDVYIELEGLWDWQSKFEGLIDNIIAWQPLPEPYREVNNE